MAGTPGTRSFASLKKTAARYVRLPDDDEALEVAGEVVNDGIASLNLRTWRWGVTTQTVTFVAGTSEYTLAAAFSSPQRFLLNNASGQTLSRLLYKMPEIFDRDIPDRTSTGDPTFYTAFTTSTLTLDTIPSTSFVAQYPTGTLRYYRRFQKLTEGGAVLDVQSEMELYVIRYAQAELAAIYAPTLHSIAVRERDRLWDLMVAKDGEQIATDWEV